MKRILLAFLLGLFANFATAEAWNIGTFINVEPSPELDLTFQIMEDFDPEQEIIMGWDGDNLDFVVVVDDQPGGMDIEKYWAGLKKEMKKDADNRKVNIVKEGAYTTDKGLPINYKVYAYQSNGELQLQIFHLITNEKVSYCLIVNAFNIARADQSLATSIQIIKTATLLK